MCKYHIVFTPKYRWKITYSQYRKNVEKILRRLYEYKGVKIIEGTSDERSRECAGKHTTENKCIKFYGISEWEKCIDDVWFYLKQIFWI